MTQEIGGRGDDKSSTAGGSQRAVRRIGKGFRVRPYPPRGGARSLVRGYPLKMNLSFHRSKDTAVLTEGCTGTGNNEIAELANHMSICLGTPSELDWLQLDPNYSPFPYRRTKSKGAKDPFFAWV